MKPPSFDDGDVEARTESAELIPKDVTRKRTESNLKSGANMLPSHGLEQTRANEQDMMDWQEGLPNADSVEEAPAVTDKYMLFGLDSRPMYPAALTFSLVWSMCMTEMQSTAVSELFGDNHGFACSNWFRWFYVVTIGCFAYSALCDPGMMKEELWRKVQSHEMAMPKRAVKHWFYKRPILRMNHYCRWTTNVIGLRNHREFVCMLTGFVIIAVTDAVVDAVLVPAHLTVGTWTGEFMLVLHLAYSVFLAKYTVPLIRQHYGHISRNELVQEWKTDDFYIIRDKETGRIESVPDLDGDKYNEYFDDFIYDPTRNPFDKGLTQNMLAFWCRSRWNPDELGEF
mmetsp:Transcript_102627/g.290029  ORF Transcript_102627/g.290029 Transcript_102627/m.290029 type:complete len:341 (-) Transcript_102627:174-1196(-)